MGKPNLQDMMDDYMVRIFQAAFKHILEKIEEPVNMCSPEPRCEPVPDFVRPDWMPKGWWLAQETSGDWYIYSDKPTFNGYMWNGADRFALIPNCLNWTPPVVDSPVNSLHYLA